MKVWCFALLFVTGLAQAKDMRVETISSYFCLFNQTDDTQQIQKVEKIHFFHQQRFDPWSIPSHHSDVYCHNRELYGEVDSPLFPRLGARANAFSVFAKPASDTSYASLTVQTSPVGSNEVLGYVALPLITNSESYCGTIQGVETEPVFVAAQVEPISPNLLIASESELRDAWFYIKDGTPVRPSSSRDLTRTIYFYWPINTYVPLVKSPDQVLYRIVTPQHAKLDLSTVVTLPNRSFGCVPKTLLGASESRRIGESCTYDVECSSLLCSKFTNTCSSNIVDYKPVGTSCVASDRCGHSNITTLETILIGTTEDGRPDCVTSGRVERVSNRCVNYTCESAQAKPPVVDPRCI